MGLGNLRNQPCPCNSGKKYKKCHWPMPWKNIRLGLVSLTENFRPTALNEKPIDMERQIFGGGGGMTLTTKEDHGDNS
jgi:hypothetical protein